MLDYTTILVHFLRKIFLIFVMKLKRGINWAVNLAEIPEIK